jgi:hypothetical protein
VAKAYDQAGHADTARAWRLGIAGPPPRMAKVMLTINADLTRGVLGPPEAVQAQEDGGTLWAYRSGALLLLIDTIPGGRGIYAIQLNTPESGDVQGVRVGDPVSAAIRKWGVPSERDGQRLVFDRYDWYLAVITEGDVIKSMGAVSK